MLDFLQKLNKRFVYTSLIGAGIVVVFGLLLFSYDAYATREAGESGLSKRNIIQFITEESENFISEVFLGKPTPNALKRSDSRRATLKKFGKTIDLDSDAKKTKSDLVKDPISNNRGDLLIKKTDNYLVEYTRLTDLFFVTILKEPVEKYQKESEAWFKSQGFKKDELCGLGINFTLPVGLALKVGYPINQHLPYCK